MWQPLYSFSLKYAAVSFIFILQLYLINSYTRRKAYYLIYNINSKFSYLTKTYQRIYYFTTIYFRVSWKFIRSDV